MPRMRLVGGMGYDTLKLSVRKKQALGHLQTGGRGRKRGEERIGKGNDRTAGWEVK